MQLSWLARGLRTGILTTRYPRVPESMPDRWRGVVLLEPTHCQPESARPPCVAVCPSSALWLDPTPAGNGLGIVRLDPMACVACGLCVPACPAGALEMTPRFELAELVHRDGRTAE